MTVVPSDNDPDEDLVAYLDGELVGDEVRQVEDQLARDAQSRSRVQSLKKTYDLLDYLPKPEPSEDFATRTLTQAIPKPVSTASLPIAQKTSSPSWWPWVAAAFLATVMGLSLGAWARPNANESEPITSELLPVIARLPLYTGVDDLDFLRKLDKPDLFADDPGEPSNPITPRLDRPHSTEIQAKLFEQFRSLPSARRKQIIELDQQFRQLPNGERDHLGRVLENYAVWLDRLPGPIRSDVLDAPNGSDRIKSIELAMTKEWHETLPLEKKQKLKLMPDLNQKATLSKQWLDEEVERRKEWQLAARQWQSIKDGKRPWPFDNELLRNEIEQYVKNVLKTDAGTTRLTNAELAKLEMLRRNPERDFGWFLLGTYLLELSERHPSLPEGKEPPLTQPSQLPDAIRKEFANRVNPNFQNRLKNATGRWPEFALLIDTEHKARKFGVLPNLGPTRISDLNPTIEAYVTANLIPKLTSKQASELKNLEGRWPEFPRKLVELCGTHDLSMPGVMLPGLPSLWKQYYRYTSAKMEKSVSKPNGN